VEFYSAWAPRGRIRYNPPLMISRILSRFGLSSPWSRELAMAVLALLFGVVLLPALIFYAGATLLGRYEGASLGHLYGTIFTGLGQGSPASWAVLLGPYGLYLLFKALRAWWRASALLA
jgi:hypothetical protein